MKYFIFLVLLFIGCSKTCNIENKKDCEPQPVKVSLPEVEKDVGIKKLEKDIEGKKSKYQRHVEIITEAFFIVLFEPRNKPNIQKNKELTIKNTEKYKSVFDKEEVAEKPKSKESTTFHYDPYSGSMKIGDENKAKLHYNPFSGKIENSDPSKDGERAFYSGAFGWDK